GLVGAVGAAVYASSSPRDCAYVVEHSDAVGVLAEDDEQRAKLDGAGVEHLLTFADLDDLRARGRAYAAEHPEALAQVEAAVAEALQAVRPTVLPSVPRVYEKVHAAVVSQFDRQTGPRRRIVDWALAVGRDVSEAKAAGRPIPRGLARRHRLADRLVYSKVKE